MIIGKIHGDCLDALSLFGTLKNIRMLQNPYSYGLVRFVMQGANARVLDVFTDPAISDTDIAVIFFSENIQTQRNISCEAYQHTFE